MDITKSVRNLKQAHDQYGQSSHQFDEALKAVFSALSENQPQPVRLEIQNSAIGIKSNL